MDFVLLPEIVLYKAERKMFLKVAFHRFKNAVYPL